MWWTITEPALKKASGVDVDMDSYVVYKNFPKEVLNKSDSQYWFAQICMYIGLPNELFTEETTTRPLMDDTLSLKILPLSTTETPSDIASEILLTQTAWTPQNFEDICLLAQSRYVSHVDMGTVGNRANGAKFIASHLTTVPFTLNAPTDVLRIVAGISENDTDLRTVGRLKNMSRPVRRDVTQWLAQFSQEHLESDFSLRKKSWKILLHALHTGARTDALGKATASLRAGTLKTLEGDIEHFIKSKDIAVLTLLESHPGHFMRRLHKLYSTFGKSAFTHFSQKNVLNELSVGQLLKLNAYLSTVSQRATYLYTPKGKMAKSQPVTRTKPTIDAQDLSSLKTVLTQEISSRLKIAHPEGFDVDPRIKNVFIPSGEQEADIGRGTVYSIPDSVNFIRTASYWEAPSTNNVWFDNGWSFFDENWAGANHLTWDHPKLKYEKKTLAAFSGDPTNSKDQKGRACQMIDLYLNPLEKSPFRYAVWSILCYSKVPFSNVNTVLATLQWGKDAEKGALYDPNRAQIILPLKGQELTKAVAVLDIQNRTITVLDASIPMNVSSAGYSDVSVQTRVPALLDVIAASPTVWDLFHLHPGTMPVRYDDAHVPVTGQGYVFSPLNPDSDFKPLAIADILALKGIS
jgi:hypothetical protein